MTYLLDLAVLLSCALAAFHVGVMLPWVWRTATARRPQAKAYAPKAAVVLNVRGPDPFLARCLRGLLTQDYPQYDVFVVVDHPDDPAWRQVHDLVGDEPHVHVDVIRERRTTCALKCSGHRQVLNELDPSYQVVAWLDGDVVPHPTYLRELIAPLGDERIGCTTGNRWYLPCDAEWGSLVRYLWNAVVIAPMYWHGIVWGGSAAFRTSLLRRSELVDGLALSLSDDSELRAAVDAAGLRTYTVPSLLMTNSESCRLDDLKHWLTRQFFLIQVYYQAKPLAWLTRGYVAVIGVWGTLIVAACGQVIAGDNSAALLRALGSVGLVAASVLVWAPILEATAALVRRRRGDAARWLTPRKFARLLAAVPLTAVVVFSTLRAASRLTVYPWRGIRYRVAGPHDVRMESYAPFAQTIAPAETASVASTM